MLVVALVELSHEDGTYSVVHLLLCEHFGAGLVRRVFLLAVLLCLEHTFNVCLVEGYLGIGGLYLLEPVVK